MTGHQPSFPVHLVNPVCFGLTVFVIFCHICRQDLQDLQDLQDENKSERRSAVLSCSSCRSCLFWFVDPVLALEFQAAGAEVKQQADVDAGGGQVVDDLDFMSSDERHDRLVLHEYPILDEHVGFEFADYDAIIRDRERPLAIDTKPRLAQFMGYFDCGTAPLLRHRYQVAMVRYGRHGSASSVSAFGCGTSSISNTC